MSYSQEFLDFCLEQLASAGEVTYKKMFGGVGIYLEGFFIACLSSDQLFLKVDDASRPKYQEAGMLPFQPFAEKKENRFKPMERFYEVPAEVLENRETLAQWAQESMAVAVGMVEGEKKGQGKSFK